LGSFWKPYYTESVYRAFFEHPPFGFLLQSFAFKALGDAYYVEAFYGFVIGLITLCLVAAIWMAARKNEAGAGVFWPVLLFVSFPMTSWILSNNMLESTMAVFVLLSVLLAIWSIRSASTRKMLILGFSSGVAVFLAFLTKGPAGLFPLVTPFAWTLVFGDTTPKKALVSFLAIASGIAISTILIVLPSKDARVFFDVYFTNQVFTSLAGKREIASSHFAILKRLFLESLAPLSLCTILYGIRRVRFNFVVNRKLFFFALVSISGILPLLISPKQMSWYLFPSLPLYSLTLASLFENSAGSIQTHVSRSKRLSMTFFGISSIVLMIALAWMLMEKGVVRRDRDFHMDFTMQEYKLPERATISTYPSQLSTNWGLVANMQRQFKVSLTDTLGQEYLISTVEYSDADTIRNHYVKVHPPRPFSYILYRKLR
jgi:4-amino-4-deoxy-L-arabinose transferase-like glycosyltransferase